MLARSSVVTLSILWAISAAGCGAASRKPCDWYFASDRANVTQGPIRWLSGVWKGGDADGDWIWTPLENGTMAGVWRRGDETPAVRFYTIRQDGTSITLVELTEDGETTTFQAIEQGERFVVFANADRGRISYRHQDAALDLTIEHADGSVERHSSRLEI